MNTIREAKIENIVITDSLFKEYTALVAKSIVPYQWEILNDRVPGAEKSYCIENFRIAAGEIDGVHRGPVFCDTDAYKWLETVAFCIENGSGKRFEETADYLIDIIGRAQQPDGYLNTYYTLVCPEKRWTNLVEGHELYGAGHLIEAAVAYKSATGKDNLLNIACRFADLICDTFGAEESKIHGYPGHQEIELAMVKLYRTTGARKYLDLAEYFIKTRGNGYFEKELIKRGDDIIFPELSPYDLSYSQSHLPPVEQKTVEGHAVRAMYMCSAMADLAKELNDSELFDACTTLWKNVTEKRMYITGGVGSSGFQERFTADYDLPNDRMYCESCASIGLMMFGKRMAALTKDSSYYDVVERALCNTVLAGISVSGDRYFYVNPLEVWPENCLDFTSMAHVKPERQPWFSVACCPTNIARTLASLGQYIWAEDNKSVYINQFISSRYSTRIQDTDVEIAMESSYMRDGKVRISVESAEAKSFTVRVRIPPYFRSCSFTLDGKSVSPAIENGYAVLAVSRAGLQTVVLQGEVKASFSAANINVRSDVGKLAVVKGPFVYCLEECENGQNLAALFVDSESDINENPAVEGLPGELPTLQVGGIRIENSTAGDALYAVPKLEKRPTVLKAVPYYLWGNRGKGEMTVWIKALI